MGRPWLLIPLVCAVVWGQSGGVAGAGSQGGRGWEQKLRSIPEPANIRAYMERMSARPHHVGSAYDRDNAEWILSKFKQWGLDAHIESFDVLFPTPRERILELVEPRHFTAKLQEPPVAADPTSAQLSEQLPTYNAYSPDGDVTAPLVYVNYGLPEDYDMLDRMGVSVKGAIVIARYGASWRGIKPKVAAQRGAAACIIYSDPRDDGYYEGQTFPDGPYRPAEGVQRGSVMDIPVRSGDPLTPGSGAITDATRLPIGQVETIAKIPVLPISYADAQPLLAALEGRVAPEGWRGGLPITYRVGPGPAKVHLRLQFNWDLKPVYDVIARIEGSEFPDQWVIRGNHHDAWVNGAEDPGSGAAALLEEARAMGALLAQGWRPRRTILYCLWDGEEEGLLGSTEWVESHAGELESKAVAYINSDSNGRGYLNAGGSHSLEKFMNGVMRDVTDPETGVSVWQRLQAHQIAFASDPSRAQEARLRGDLRIAALGSGSDYTPFLQHLGVPSLNLAFGGEDGGGIYHSIYDDFYWYTHFSDTEFVYGRALAQTAGTAVLRLADSDVLPFDFENLAETLRRYLGELRKLADTTRDQIEESNRNIDQGVFTATQDPRLPLAPPRKQPPAARLNFAQLESGVTAVQNAANAYNRASARFNARAATPQSLKEANARLMAVEQDMTTPEGLPDRPWYRHQIYAPGFYTGYGVKTIPGVRESIEQQNWPRAQTEIERVGKALEATAEAIRRASAALR
jgi:N-acetylated-alpha-linked acidic dipeptidase